MATRMQQRRGTATQWTTANPILGAGEIGYETDTAQFKIGDGINHWATLSYFKNLEDLDTDGFLTTADKDVANGLATLDGTGKIPVSQLGNLIDGAPNLLNTLNEISAAINDDENFGTTVLDAIGQEASDRADAITNAIDVAAGYAEGLVQDEVTDRNDAITAAINQEITDRNGAITTAAGTIATNITDITDPIIQDVEDLYQGLSDEVQNRSTAISTEVTDRNDAITAAIDAEVIARDSAIGVETDQRVEAIQEAITQALIDASADAGTVAATAVSNHNLDTTNIHGITDTSDLIVSSGLSTAISNHNSDTTNVHGILDTSELATKTDAQSYADGAQTDAETTASGYVSTHNSATTNVHGISNTANLATKSYVDTADSGLQTNINAKAPIESPTFTGTVAGITKSMVGLGSVDNTTDANKPISTATQTALDLKANLAGPTFTGTVSGITKSMVGLGSVDNTADTAKPVSSAQQTALDLKANLAGPTFTGTVSGITKSMVGLGSVDNTADSAKPVSTATQTALDAKLAIAGGTMTGALTLSADPSSDLHAATKQYVDAATAGLNVHASVKAATTANVNLNNAVEAGDTLDGVTLAHNDRILVKNQNTAADNGVYIVQPSGAPTRATDYNQVGEVDAGDFIFVENGTVNGKTGWIQTNAITTLGTDAIAFTQFSGAGTYSAGSALTLTGSTFSIADGAITSAKIADGAIVDADVNASAAIAKTKIAGTAITAADTGTVTSTMILDGTIVDADINVSAAIAKTKISGTAITAADTGTVTSTMILDGTILDADINASAAIAQSKISGLSTSLGLKANLADPTFTGTVTVAAAGVAFTDGTQSKEGVPSRTPISQKTASYTLSSLTERDTLVEMGSASGLTLTIPTDSAINYPIGTSLDILQTGVGMVTIAGDIGVTVNATPGLKLRTQWSSATIFKRAANTWIVYGDLKA